MCLVLGPTCCVLYSHRAWNSKIPIICPVSAGRMWMCAALVESLVPAALTTWRQEPELQFDAMRVFAKFTTTSLVHNGKQISNLVNKFNSIRLGLLVENSQDHNSSMGAEKGYINCKRHNQNELAVSRLKNAYFLTDFPN